MNNGNALAVLGFVFALVVPWIFTLRFRWSDAAKGRSNFVIPDLQPVGNGEIASYPLPFDWRYGAFMQIYVRGYKDSNGDGVGDLQGVIDNLDYLHDLGITGIWLMPITESEDRDHGYAVRNYRAIEPDYGTMSDLERLLAAAHRRGIGVVLDYVINHASAQHPLFLSAVASPHSPHRDFFVWASGAGPPGWEVFGRNPWHPAPPADADAADAANWSYFAPFWSGMPDFNLRSAAAVRFHRDNIRFWLNKQVRRAAAAGRAGPAQRRRRAAEERSLRAGVVEAPQLGRPRAGRRLARRPCSMWSPYPAPREGAPGSVGAGGRRPESGDWQGGGAALGAGLAR